MKNNTILALVFLIAGTLLAVGVTSMVPAAYAGEDEGNKNLAEDESQASIADCDNNEIEDVEFYFCEAFSETFTETGAPE